MCRIVQSTTSVVPQAKQSELLDISRFGSIAHGREGEVVGVGVNYDRMRPEDAGLFKCSGSLTLVMTLRCQIVSTALLQPR